MTARRKDPDEQEEDVLSPDSWDLASAWPQEATTSPATEAPAAPISQRSHQTAPPPANYTKQLEAHKRNPKTAAPPANYDPVAWPEALRQKDPPRPASFTVDPNATKSEPLISDSTRPRGRAMPPPSLLVPTPASLVVPLQTLLLPSLTAPTIAESPPAPPEEPPAPPQKPQLSPEDGLDDDGAYTPPSRGLYVAIIIGAGLIAVVGGVVFASLVSRRSPQVTHASATSRSTNVSSTPAYPAPGPQPPTLETPIPSAAAALGPGPVRAVDLAPVAPTTSAGSVAPAKSVTPVTQDAPKPTPARAPPAASATPSSNPGGPPPGFEILKHNL